MKEPGHLTDQQYSRFRDMILERTGMLFGPRRRDALARALLAAAKRGGWEDMEGYYLALRQASTREKLWDELIGLIFIGETYFFRNAAHFEILRREIFPELIARHEADRRLRIWSAGCASGEEPYSVAILLRQLLPDINGWNIFILGTDINRQALKRACEGRYRAWSFRQTEPAIRKRYFIRRDGYYEVKPELRGMVRLAYLNLVEDVYPSGSTNTYGMDLILCRNVAIYLPQTVMRDITARFYDCLAPEGWLIVGASETGNDLYDAFVARTFPGATMYQKEGASNMESKRSSGNGIPSPPGEPARRLRAIPPQPPTEFPPGERPMDAVELYRDGLKLLEEGKCKEAFQRFLTCVHHDPGAALACCEIARMCADQGRLKEALQWCQQALRHEPGLVEARYILALVHLQSGSRGKAVSELKKILYLDPEFVPAHIALANLYRQVGRSHQADRHRAQVLRLAAGMAPDSPMPGAEGLTAGQFLSRVKAMPQVPPLCRPPASRG